MKRKPMFQYTLALMMVLIVGFFAFLPEAFAAHEALVLSVNPALAGQQTTATIALENVADVESLHLELSFASGNILSLPSANWFARDAYFPESPFGPVPTVDANDSRVIATAGKIHMTGFDPTGSSGNIGQVTFRVSYGATTGATQILSLSGQFFSRSEQAVKTLAPVMATFTVGQYPNIFALPTVRLFEATDVGSQSAAQSIVVQNTGLTDLVVDDLFVYGVNASEFSIVNDGCSGQTIPPGESRTVEVIFSRDSEGVKIAYLSIPSNDPDTPVLSIPLNISEDTVLFKDSDNDGISDDIESGGCTEPDDADTDDDGIEDGDEDINRNGVVDEGETDPCKIDTDDDGIQDGTEIRLTLADIGPDTNTDIFQQDLDPLTRTNPLLDDTDSDGVKDGYEDSNQNGRIDAGEHDPDDSGSFPDFMAGDINGNYGIDIDDAILAIQIASGINPGAVVYIEADVNGDNKIGMEEAVYILEKVLGSRD